MQCISIAILDLLNEGMKLQRTIFYFQHLVGLRAGFGELFFNQQTRYNGKPMVVARTMGNAMVGIYHRIDGCLVA
jgi:hypothetical protein